MFNKFIIVQIWSRKCGYDDAEENREMSWGLNLCYSTLEFYTFVVNSLCYHVIDMLQQHIHRKYYWKHFLKRNYLFESENLWKGVWEIYPHMDVLHVSL